WRSACARAGLAGKLVHDMRRSAIRNFERAGVSRSAGMAMSGQETESVYRRYSIADAAALLKADFGPDGAEFELIRNFYRVFGFSDKHIPFFIDCKFAP